MIELSRMRMELKGERTCFTVGLSEKPKQCDRGKKEKRRNEGYRIKAGGLASKKQDQFVVCVVPKYCTH